MIETQASDCVKEKMEEEVAGEEEDEEDEEGVGLRKGCDPFYMTRRGKLQTERRKLNDQIIREARLREGAQNLYRATNNTKVRESVFLELSFVNSNLQLLWELLSQVNGSVDVYQPERALQKTANTSEKLATMPQEMCRLPGFWRPPPGDDSRPRIDNGGEQPISAASLTAAAAPGEDSRDQEKALMDVHETLPEGPSMHVVVTNLDERTKLALGHLSKAVWRHEDAVRTASSLGRLGDLQNFLATARDQAKTRLAKFETDGGFINSSEAPEIAPETHHNPELKPPVFDKVEGTDIFRRLGPLSVFSAKQCLSKPRKVHLSKPAEGYGMRLGGDSPVRVVLVQPGSAAMRSGIKECDYIIGVGGQDCRWLGQAAVADLMTQAGMAGVEVEVVTPLRLLTFSEGSPEQRRIDSSPRPLATGTITGASTLTSGERVRGRKTLRDKVSSLFGRKKSRPKSVPGTLSSMFDSTKDWRGY
ncbi:rhophilin-2-like [Lampetra planeri]